MIKLNITDRYKYQKGKCDNNLDFTAENEYDNLIIAINRNRIIIDQRNFDNFTKATAKTITQEVEKQISQAFKQPYFRFFSFRQGNIPKSDLN